MKTDFRKSKDAFSFLTLLCAKVCLQFDIFSRLKITVFAVHFDRTLDMDFGSVRKQKTFWQFTCCLYLNYSAYSTTESNQYKIRSSVAPWVVRYKILVRKRVSLYFFKL